MSRPRTVPSRRLARLVSKSEPGVQSGNTTNGRNRKPAANGASATAPTIETSSSRYIAISSARYGNADDATSSSVRASLGLAYGATAAFQGARAPPTTASSTAAPALIGPPSFGH